MLIVLISWIYIFLISISIGLVVNRVCGRLVPTPSWKENRHFGITGLVVTGLVALTVYAEIFSLFYKVGAICHILMLICVVASCFLSWDEIKTIFKAIQKPYKENKLIVLLMIILLAAFFTSRGSFHTDTGIYHAQAIRLLEEYGVIKGLGNLQLHFAYNSAYLPLCALFTMSFILPFPIHSMTGFFMVLFSCYAVEGLFHISERKRHGGDLARIAILVYALSNMTGLQSPATDYGTMFMTLYILCGWITYAQEKKENASCDGEIAYYGYLSVLAIFAVSMKLSAALLVLLAVCPAVLLVKRKMFKQLGLFVLIGFISFLPYMIRNVILSGWLFYPVKAIDLFDVIWKIPAEYMKVDSDQIKVWGRCLFDITRVDEGVSSWLPIWWEAKQHYEKMLIYSQLVGGVLLLIMAVIRIRQKKLKFATVVFYITVFANLAMWFFTAPFIRYGLAFLLILPLCAVGEAIDCITEKKSITLIVLSSLVIINFFSWIDNYFMDDLVFVKHHLTDGYYVEQVPFDTGNMTAMDMDGQTVYVSDIDEVNSYYVFPGSCYGGMVERTELIGNTVKEGFKAKVK